MVAYEFYAKKGSNGSDLIGILPERRKLPTRITRRSIMKWGRLVAGSCVNLNTLHFVRVEAEQAQGNFVKSSPGRP